MFTTITRLLFGGGQETPEDVKSEEVVDEEWFLVGHQEANNEVSLAEKQEAEVTNNQSANTTLVQDTPTNPENDTSLLDPELTAQSSIAASEAISGSTSQASVLAKMTQLSCIQRAKAWTDRHHMSRNAIQRQNHTRQSSQHQLFHLHQPGHRNLSH